MEPSADRPVEQRAALPVVKRLLSRRGDTALHAASARSERRMPMVGWFDPKQLLSTGVKTLFSLVVGERSDRRLMLALAATNKQPYDHTCFFKESAEGPVPDRQQPHEELWLDFICDTGDGWNPTYAIAYAAAQPQLNVRGADGQDLMLPQGQVLVFGGDEVYPTPSREEYQRRLVMPFTKAFGDARPQERPVAYAIPGNHDWYDGLNAFSRLFCSDVGGRGFGGWRTQQQRSYFALELPGNWWLCGCDGQLQSDIDTGQIEYFRSVADKMKKGDKVILCLSLPVWTYAHKYRSMGRVFDETDLLYLRDQVFAPKEVEVKVYLTGDLHHYRRHEELIDARLGVSPVQKITAGGGGAFLHPTHEEDLSLITEASSDPDVPPRSFRLRASYPDEKRSSRLAWGNLLFLFKNPWAGILPALLYLITAWLLSVGVPQPPDGDLVLAVRMTVNVLASNPALALWLFGFVAAFWAFTDTHSFLYRMVASTLHCAAHLAALFYVGWGSMDVAHWLFGNSPILSALAGGAMVFAGGWIVGSVILGLYLLVSINVFGRHSEEAFSALRIEDFKHFLRLRFGKDGTLTIYPIKVERVPRRWRDRKAADGSPSAVQPSEPLKAELIEPPVVVR